MPPGDMFIIPYECVVSPCHTQPGRLFNGCPVTSSPCPRGRPLVPWISSKSQGSSFEIARGIARLIFLANTQIISLARYLVLHMCIIRSEAMREFLSASWSFWSSWSLAFLLVVLVILVSCCLSGVFITLVNPIVDLVNFGARPSSRPSYSSAAFSFFGQSSWSSSKIGILVTFIEVGPSAWHSRHLGYYLFIVNQKLLLSLSAVL